ncbi:transcriptional regulator domain-containing protein [Novosphingobium pokkalii]|uniref:Transcriptional regulator domain-containing protein n=1 Tax=Novosphingobium pokkalii TaxID=1770194 RepID=A0ABV7UZZ4_9SPHN|nr:DUF6499 domain-containing protein [Novosphingobium pokkalii]
MSPGADRREDDPSRFAEQFDLSGIAFEFLRRNPEYQSDYAAARADPGSTRPEEGARAAARWGLRFPD